MTAAPVPLIVLTTRQDDVEIINRLLRDAGHAAHCQWVRELDELGAALESAEPQLLWLFCDHFDSDIRNVADARSKHSAALPLIAVQEDATEEAAAAALNSGAHDLISLRFKDRVRAVAERELRAYHLEKALSNSLQSARQYKQQLQAFMAGSIDAIAHASDGILVDANQAWAKLFGRETGDMLGPIMDWFDSGSHIAIKGALVAAAQGQWIGEPLKVAGLTADGSLLPLALQLETSVFDGEPAIKISVPRKSQDQQAPEVLMQKAIARDPETGVYHRRHLLELLNQRLATKPTSGVRALAHIRPDRFGDIAEEVGPLASEDVLVQLASLIGQLSQPNDVYGRFGGNIFLVWIERGTLRDIEAWANNAIVKIADTIFESGGTTVSLKCTIGLADIGPHTDDLDALIRGAQRASQRGRQRGGNQVVLEETSDESTRIQRFDEVWVQQLRSALMENRFRLTRHPIASLCAQPLKLFDTAVRMIDQQGEEVSPATFLPVAARNNLLRAVDRWIVGTAIAMSREPGVDCIFVKLSGASIVDDDLMQWFAKRVQTANADPSRVCIEIAEQLATQHLTQTIALATKLRSSGFKLAIEHFGIGRDPQRVISQIPMDYVKIDGSLMQGVAGSADRQTKVGILQKAAASQNIQTIAERVEDANTMAVLFQLGIGYVQGHYIHEPEVILEDVV